MMRCLAHRARQICSQSTLGNELQVLRSIFTRNGYPGHVLDKYQQLSPPSSPSFIGPEHCPGIIRLPWVGSISTHLERKIRTSVRLAYFSVQVYAVYHKSRAFVLPKDKLPSPSLSNVIYLFECRHCESRYVGKTTQHLSDRIKQHIPKHLVEPPQEGKKRGRGRPLKNLTKLSW